MLKPEYIQSVPDQMVKLYAQAEADILADMARRISTYDYWIPAAEHQAKMLEEAGVTREEIIKRLKKLTGKTQEELEELMKEAGTVALKSDDEVYKRNGLEPPPVAASADLQSVLQAGYDKTSGTFQNLTMTTAQTATWQFERALDMAYMQITMGGFDYNTAIRSAIKQLSADGVGAIRYPSGKIDTIEVAVRRATITGVNQTALKLQSVRADEMGCDLVEVSAHSGARPSHQAWQGQIYSRSGKSEKYPDFVKTTLYGKGEGLGGWNCSHSFRPWFEGMSRTYSEELLEDYAAKKFEYNGKKLTEYEALQEQRHIERGIRRWKREQNALAAAGLDTSEATAKVREWNRKHKDFLEQTGLKPDGTRTVVGKTVEKQQSNGIIKASGATGAKKTLGWQDRHADLMYEEIRKRTTDCKKISQNTIFTEKAVAEIKDHMFVKKHRFADGSSRRFDPDFEQAQAWDRLFHGNHTEVDEMMLKHEYVELTQMRLYNMVYEDAHEIANTKHNWFKALITSGKEA